MISFGSFGSNKNNSLLPYQNRPIKPKPKFPLQHSLSSSSSSVINFASKRKLDISGLSGRSVLSSKCVEKKPKIEQTKPAETKPKETKDKQLGTYDSISARLTSIISKWIIQTNTELIKKFLGDLQSPSRSCDVFCLIGPSGCGKSVLIQYMMKSLKGKWIMYDDFADVGKRDPNNESNGGHACQGFLSVLLQDAAPFVLVIDGPDGETHTDFQQLLINEYNQYTPYRRPNKSIVLLVESLDTYCLRNWIRTIGAYKYYLGTTLKYQQQEFLRQQIHSICPLRSIEPIQQFAGDFRRMGIDLIACSQEGQQFHPNSNSVEKVPSIFELTRHLMTWPVDLLHNVYVCGDISVDQLFVMCAHNQLSRTSKIDEISQMASDLSNIELMLVGDDGDKSLFIYPSHNLAKLSSEFDPSLLTSRKPYVDCNQPKMLALVYALYGSNLRLRLDGQLRSSKSYSVEFAKSRYFRDKWQSHDKLDNLAVNRFRLEDNYLQTPCVTIDRRPVYWT